MKRKLEEMESENDDNFPLVMEMVKGYCEEKEEKKKEPEEDKNKKNKIMRGNKNRGGMMIVGRDSNGKLIRIAKSYSEAWKEKKLREEEEKKKKKSNGEPEETLPPRQPRWSDENLAVHIWTGMCRSKGMTPQKYQLRNDYRNMNRQEINLDLLFRKVYKTKEEAAAATASTS
ncbi:hypothetical protein Tco_0248088 [Tanacetum coccineum]